MALSEDYQWPYPDPARLQPFAETGSAEQIEAHTAAIEEFFSARYGLPAVLMPSGRAALAAAFRYRQLNRSNVIHAPMWSSHCIWGTIGVGSNPTLSLEPAPDAMLVVHKWGYPVTVAGRYECYIIEDSVDSCFETPESFFLNGGTFEIISLPKVIASYCGAVVLASDESLRHFLKQEQGNNPVLGRINSELKHRGAMGTLPPHETWDGMEHANTSLDLNGLNDILAKLANLDLNIATIRSRFDAVKIGPLGKHVPKTAAGRLPCVVPLPVKLFNDTALDGVMVRNFNTSQVQDRPKYEPCYLLPLHFRMADNVHNDITGRLTETLRV